MAGPMNDLSAPFDLEDLDMPVFGDLNDLEYTDVDFAEAEFADVDLGAWQNFEFDENGFVVSDEKPTDPASELPPEASASNEAFVAEFMAGIQQRPFNNGDVLPSWEEYEAIFGQYAGDKQSPENGNSQQSDVERQPPLPEHTQPVKVQDQQVVVEAPRSPSGDADHQVPQSEHLETLVIDMDAPVSTDDDADSLPDGCKAPPSTPKPLEEQSSGMTMPIAIVEQAPAMPVSTAAPVPQAFYHYPTIPIPANGALAPPSLLQVERQAETSAQIKFSTRPHPLSYQCRIETLEAAHQALDDPGEEVALVKLTPTGEDDWQLVKGQQLHGLAAQLYDAIQAEPGEPPENFTAFQRDYYHEHQFKVLSNIKETITTKPVEAEARVLLVLEELINIHENGLPEPAFHRKATTGSNFGVEVNLTCSERAEKIIEMARNDKYAAQDILGGINLADMTRSPIKYLERKRGNSRVNAKKAENVRLAAQGQCVPVAARGRKAVMTPTVAGRQMFSAPSRQPPRAAIPEAAPVMPMAVSRTGPIPRIKATLKRNVVGESDGAVAKRAKHGDWQ